MIVILIYVLIGFIFATVGYTLIDSFCEIIAYAIALYKAKMNLAITKYNTEINKLTAPEPESHAAAIGFVVSGGEEEYE